MRQELEIELPSQLLATTGQQSSVERRSLPSDRTEAVRRAREFIEDQARHAPTIADVCRIARVSWRTLDYAFREQLGVTPKRYLPAVRLNHVRRKLIQAGVTERVVDIALRWGFWHAS